MPKSYLTPREVAKRLMISVASVRQISEAGKLKVYQTPGGHRRFMVKDIEKYLAELGSPETPQDYLTPVEAADRLMISVASVRQWAEKGALKAHITPGGHRRFLVEDVDNFSATSC